MLKGHKHEFDGQNARFKADQQYEAVWKSCKVPAVI